MPELGILTHEVAVQRVEGGVLREPPFYISQHSNSDAARVGEVGWR